MSVARTITSTITTQRMEKPTMNASNAFECVCSGGKCGCPGRRRPGLGVWEMAMGVSSGSGLDGGRRPAAVASAEALRVARQAPVLEQHPGDERDDHHREA